MITIAKASAGSGKTYTLAKTYIEFLLRSDDPQAYRHILAVTFTNKVADEMKSRIIKELYILSTNPKESNYFNDFYPSVCPDIGKLSQKAGECLSAILHDYGAFAVSTIDSFFQRTLKAFAREIGQFASYQVELDRDSLIAESVDRLLDGLSADDNDRLSWLKDSSMYRLESGERFKTDALLGEIAPSLESDRFREAFEKAGVKPEELFSKDNLLQIKKVCDDIIKEFEKLVKTTADAVNKSFKDNALSFDVTFKGFMAKVLDYREIKAGEKIEKPTAAFLKRASDYSSWFKKNDAPKYAHLDLVLSPVVEKFLDIWGTPFREYNTARIIRGQIYSLGLAGALSKEFKALMQEKNVLCLDDSNRILRDIIDGSDAPFVFEKLGVRFENFLIDEFQDTSTIQWENFKPLLKESEDNNKANLVVGDVKQSIYRFRGSDWRLLSEVLPKSFSEKADLPLDHNFRTLPRIVEFNNDFFKYAVRKVSEYLGEDPDGDKSLLSTVYADVKQIACPKDDPAPGNVSVVFFEDNEEQMAEIVSTVREILSSGAIPKDIAVLVRWNRDGSRIASRLISEGIPVVSDDSLQVKSSAVVRLVVSAFAIVDNPPREGSKTPVAAFEALEAGLEVPDSYDSLYDLAEKTIAAIEKIRPGIMDGEVPYVQSFMDYLQDWVSLNGNNLTAFLEKWKDTDLKISSPSVDSSVRIITIHKSKGLEFPYVIFPFVEGIELFKPDGGSFSSGIGEWRRLDSKGTKFSSVEGIFNVKFSSKSEDTLFADSYSEEKRLQAIDALNTLYVAMTRPMKGLKVIGKLPSKEKREKGGLASTMADILYSYTEGGTYVGEPYDFAKMKRKDDGVKRIPLGYPSFLPDDGGRLRISTDASDYFGDDGTTGLSASERIRGIVLHGILSSVKVPSDLPGAVEKAVSDGLVPASEKDKILKFLQDEIDSVADRGWFPDDPSRVLNEKTIIDADGTPHRPDRIVIDGSSAIVIDYKFGKPHPKYITQISAYAGALRRIGFTSVEAHLWYISEEGEDTIS